MENKSPENITMNDTEENIDVELVSGRPLQNYSFDQDDMMDQQIESPKPADENDLPCSLTPTEAEGQLAREPLNDELLHGFRILRELMHDTNKSVNWPFMDPINVEELGLWDYTERIKHPMWLKKMKEKFDERVYRTITDFVADVRLMLENCYRYNGPDHPISKRGQRLETVIEQKLALLSRKLREKTTIQATSGQSEEGGIISNTRRRGGRSITPHDSSLLLNQLRMEEQQKERDLRRQQILDKKACVEAFMQTLQDWEDKLLEEPIKSHLKAMYEIPQIGHFLFLCQEPLNIGEVVQYELECSFVMPRQSSTLQKVMTTLLSTPYQRTKLDRKPMMPYLLWEDKLRIKLQLWYKLLHDYGNDVERTANKLAIDAKFFHVMGLKNPLMRKKFHELTLYQRVVAVKALCDINLDSQESLRDTIEAQQPEETREYLLGVDAKGNSYLHFPQFCGADLRIYRHGPIRYSSFSPQKALNKSKTYATPVKKNPKESSIKYSNRKERRRKRERKKEEIITPSRPSHLRQRIKPVLKQNETLSSSDYDSDSEFSSIAPYQESEPLPENTDTSETKKTTDNDECNKISKSNNDKIHNASTRSQSEDRMVLKKDSDATGTDATNDANLQSDIIGGTVQGETLNQVPSVQGDKLNQDVIQGETSDKLSVDIKNENETTEEKPVTLNEDTVASDSVHNKTAECGSIKHENDTVTKDSGDRSDIIREANNTVDDDSGNRHPEDGQSDITNTCDSSNHDNKKEESEDEEEMEEVLPNLEEFELIIESVEQLRELTNKFAENEPPVPTPMKRSKAVKSVTRKRCEIELHDRLVYLVSELEPWESKLIQANKKAKIKLRKEFEEFKEEEQEVEDVWSSDEPVSEFSDDGGSFDDNDSLMDTQSVNSNNSNRKKRIKVKVKEEHIPSSLVDEDLIDVSSRGRVRKRRLIPNNVADQFKFKKIKKEGDSSENSTPVKSVVGVKKVDQTPALSHLVFPAKSSEMTVRPHVTILPTNPQGGDNVQMSNLQLIYTPQGPMLVQGAIKSTQIQSLLQALGSNNTLGAKQTFPPFQFSGKVATSASSSKISSVSVGGQQIVQPNASARTFQIVTPGLTPTLLGGRQTVNLSTGSGIMGSSLQLPGQATLPILGQQFIQTNLPAGSNVVTTPTQLANPLVGSTIPIISEGRHQTIQTFLPAASGIMGTLQLPGQVAPPVVLSNIPVVGGQQIVSTASGSINIQVPVQAAPPKIQPIVPNLNNQQAIQTVMPTITSNVMSALPMYTVSSSASGMSSNSRAPFYNYNPIEGLPANIQHALIKNQPHGPVSPRKGTASSPGIQSQSITIDQSHTVSMTHDPSNTAPLANQNAVDSLNALVSPNKIISKLQAIPPKQDRPLAAKLVPDTKIIVSEISHTAMLQMMSPPKPPKYASNLTVKALLERANKSTVKNVKSDITSTSTISCQPEVSSPVPVQLFKNVEGMVTKVTDTKAEELSYSQIIESAVKAVITSVQTSVPTMQLNVPSPVIMPNIQPRRPVTQVAQAMKCPIPVAQPFQSSVKQVPSLVTSENRTNMETGNKMSGELASINIGGTPVQGYMSPQGFFIPQHIVQQSVALQNLLGAKAMNKPVVIQGITAHNVTPIVTQQYNTATPIVPEASYRSTLTLPQSMAVSSTNLTKPMAPSATCHNSSVGTQPMPSLVPRLSSMPGPSVTMSMVSPNTSNIRLFTQPQQHQGHILTTGSSEAVVSTPQLFVRQPSNPGVQFPVQYGLRGLPSPSSDVQVNPIHYKGVPVQQTVLRYVVPTEPQVTQTMQQQLSQARPGQVMNIPPLNSLVIQSPTNISPFPGQQKVMLFNINGQLMTAQGIPVTISNGSLQLQSINNQIVSMATTNTFSTQLVNSVKTTLAQQKITMNEVPSVQSVDTPVSASKSDTGPDNKHIAMVIKHMLGAKDIPKSNQLQAGGIKPVDKHTLASDSDVTQAPPNIGDVTKPLTASCDVLPQSQAPGNIDTMQLHIPDPPSASVRVKNEAELILTEKKKEHLISETDNDKIKPKEIVYSILKKNTPKMHDGKPVVEKHLKQVMVKLANGKIVKTIMPSNIDLKTFQGLAVNKQVDNVKTIAVTPVTTTSNTSITSVVSENIKNDASYLIVQMAKREAERQKIDTNSQNKNGNVLSTKQKKTEVADDKTKSETPENDRQAVISKSELETGSECRTQDVVNSLVNGNKEAELSALSILSAVASQQLGNNPTD